MAWLAGDSPGMEPTLSERESGVLATTLKAYLIRKRVIYRPYLQIKCHTFGRYLGTLRLEGYRPRVIVGEFLVSRFYVATLVCDGT